MSAQVDTFLEDETAPEDGLINLRLAVEAYPEWIQRLGNPDLKRSFLSHASSTVPYYREIFAGRECCELGAFPVVDRSQHKARRGDFVSTAFDDPRAEELFIRTNGTFSPSLRVSWDLPSFFDLNHASYIRFAAVLPDLVDAASSGEPTIFIISDRREDVRASIVMPGLNETILRRLLIGRGDASDVSLVRYLRAARIALLHGKPSVLSKLVDADCSLGGPAHIRPMHLVCSGENLYADDRARLEAWFGCDVLEAYVASEGGVIAFECEARAGMHVLENQLTLEVADGNGEARSVGSGDLILTNALNWRHAFIRYRIGDCATVVRQECRCGHDGQTVIALPGRDRASYAVDGQSVAAEDVARAMAAVGARVKQYQVAPASENTIAISWMTATSSADDADTADAIAASLRARIPHVKFDLRRVAQITPPGSKLRRFL